MLNSQHTSKSTFVAATRLPSDVQKYLTSSSSFPNSGVIAYIGVIYIISGDGKLYAFNTDFGVRWSTPFTAPLNYTFVGTPAISGNGTLYIAARTTTSQNYLFAVVDKGTGSNGGGALKWQVKVDGNSSVSPVLDLSDNIYIGTDNGSIYAILDGSIKGQVLWKYPSTAGGFPVTGTPTFDISYNRLCFTIANTTSLTSSTSTLYVVDLSQNNLGPTQTERWFYTFDNDICGTPSINDKGIIYVNTSAGNVYAFDSSSNSPLWNLNVGDTNLSSIAIDNNKQIYFTSTNAFNVVDSSNGQLEWVYPILPTQTLSASATVPNRIPTIDVSNNVYFGSLDSNLYSINTTNRAFNWRYKTGGAIQCMPIINNKNSIYFGSSDGYIYDLSGNGPSPIFLAPIAPMYMVNPQHTGQSPYIGPSSMPSLVWSPATFVSSNLFVLPTISIGRSDNSHDILYLGANNGRVYAINSLTGLRVSQFWPVNLLPTGNLISPNISSPDSVYTTPVIAPDRTIYVGTNEGLFYALNPSGSIKWYKILPFPLQSSPILDVSSGTIYLGAGSTMYAFGDAGNQAYPKWLVPFDTSNNITSSPALGNGFLTFGSADGYVYALNSFTGSLLWKYNTNAPIYASPTVDASNNVLIGNGSYQDGGLFYLNGATGLLSTAWAVNPFIPDLQPPSPPAPTTSFNGPLYNNVAVRGNTIYLSTMAYVYAINRLTGVERWQYFKANCYYTSPIIDANGTIYFSSIDARTGTGMVHSLTDTVTDFIENWVYPTNVVERLASPVLGRNNTLYLSSTANKIYALR
jgi:outer membrane protein assembly factor BamB